MQSLPDDAQIEDRQLDHAVLDLWDEEVEENALDVIAGAEYRDPEVAMFMAAHVEAARVTTRERDTIHALPDNALDFIAIHARISNSELYPWMSFDTMMKMHYPTFFRYAREVEVIVQERKRAQRQPAGAGAEMSMQQYAEMNRPAMWDGDVVDVRRERDINL